MDHAVHSHLILQPLSTLSASSGGSAVASDTRFFVDGEAACRRRWRFHERLLTASDGTEYCASIALGDCDDDGDGDELDVREIVDVGEDLVEECEALNGDDKDEEEETEETDDAVIFKAMLPDKPF